MSTRAEAIRDAISRLQVDVQSLAKEPRDRGTGMKATRQVAPTPVGQTLKTREDFSRAVYEIRGAIDDLVRLRESAKRSRSSDELRGREAEARKRLSGLEERINQLLGRPEPVRLPPGDDAKLRVAWAQGDELYVHFSRLGWERSVIVRIYTDDQGEWVAVRSLNGGARKEVSRNNAVVRPIVPLRGPLRDKAGRFTYGPRRGLVFGDGRAKAFPVAGAAVKTNDMKPSSSVPPMALSSPPKGSATDTAAAAAVVAATSSPQNEIPTLVVKSFAEAASSPSTHPMRKSPTKPSTKPAAKPLRLAPKSAKKKERTTTNTQKALSGLVAKVHSGSVKELREVEETHAQFELVFALLHGLKHSVVKAHRPRPTTRRMCGESEKYTFSHTTSGSTIPLPSRIKLRGFEFKVYAPRVFADIRRRMGIKQEEFILSICFNKYIEFVSNSKSGAFFYYSNDGKFMIKTIEQAEANCLTQMLHAYSKHLEKNPETVLCKMYGVYRLHLHHSIRGLKGTKFYFLVMESVFYTARYIHLIYDLKGSSYGRAATEKDINSQPTRNFTTTVLKDNDLRESGQTVHMGGTAAERMRAQIAADAKFLADVGIVDYSLLIGIHYPLKPDPRKALAEDEAKKTGRVPPWERAGARGRSPTVPIDTRSGYKGAMLNLETEDDEEERKKVSNQIERSKSQIKAAVGGETLSDRPDGGVAAGGGTDSPAATTDSPQGVSTGTAVNAADSAGQAIDGKRARGIVGTKPLRSVIPRTRTRSIMSNAATKEVYFIGIIDILVQYGLRKRGEYLWKSRLRGLGDSVSVIPPSSYYERFRRFAESFIK